jgi:2,3-bisphosphoglycerate-dependent phosphoglycerate mutase
MKVLLFAMSLVILSCSSTHNLYIVRHAEKLDSTPYSVLSPQGHQRAAVLRDSLLSKKINLIFATQFQRAQETAQPLATALNKPLLIYRNNAIDSIVSILKQNKSKNILLVAHSGNIPSIIEGLTGEKVKAIDENEYDNFYIIKNKKSTVELIQKKY